MNRYRSSSLDIEKGIPQGSVLGTLLFLLYINDLPKNVHDAKVVMFADDISVLISDSDAREPQIKIDKSGHTTGNLVKQERLFNKYKKNMSNVVS